MTRVIAGTWGGRRLRTPPGDATRPTTDRVRESLFSSLESWFGGLDGLRVLDLYAGSGALGLEALSRGAASATLVDSGRPAVAVLRQNVRTLGAQATVVASTAERFVAGADEFDLVLLDPPYDVPTAAVQDVVAALRVADEGLVVVERSSRDPFTWPEGREAVRDRRYGETTLWYGR